MKNSEAILVTPKKFEIQECPVPEPKDNEILILRALATLWWLRLFSKHYINHYSIRSIKFVSVCNKLF